MDKDHATGTAGMAVPFAASPAIAAGAFLDPECQVGAKPADGSLTGGQGSGRKRGTVSDSPERRARFLSSFGGYLRAIFARFFSRCGYSGMWVWDPDDPQATRIHHIVSMPASPVQPLHPAAGNRRSPPILLWWFCGRVFLNFYRPLFTGLLTHAVTAGWFTLSLSLRRPFPLTGRPSFSRSLQAAFCGFYGVCAKYAQQCESGYRMQRWSGFAAPSYFHLILAGLLPISAGPFFTWN